jgi:hypothetical protein
MLTYYVILTREGRVKKPTLFTQLARAKYWAKEDGDSVVEVEISLTKEPLFIRKE